jgi:putative spermidine/putrescine transport system substrate-binding protein
MVLTRKLPVRHSRREFIKGIVGGAAVMSAPAILKGLSRRSRAADANTIRMLITAPTMDPGDWSTFERDTGLKMEISTIKDDPGLFVTEITVNDGGERYDIISTLTGTERTLSKSGHIIPVDPSKLKNWQGIDPKIRDMPFLNFDEKHWGVPLAMNADTFGYFPAKLNEPRPPEPASWALIFESEKTKGKSSTGDNYIYLEEAAAYLKVTGKADIKDPANLTPQEAETAADYMIERKKAGQFRNFWTTFDDQVADIKNGEVLAIRCWEPAVKIVQKEGLDFVYADAEFYNKWAHGCYIPTQVRDRDKLDQVYTALNWIVGGGYAVLISPLRGYVTARPDLGKTYAAEHGMPDQVTKALDEAETKVARKFQASLFWFNGIPDHLDASVAAMDRVLSA